MSKKSKMSTFSGDQVRAHARRETFSPVEAPNVVRRNCKTTTIIERDGSLRERVSLQVPHAKDREQLICLHYLRHHTRCFLTAGRDDVLREGVSVDIVGRDAPWDFEIALSTGDHFFVEITAIADSQFQFEREKREERLLLLSGRPQIRVRDLRKLLKMFPSERIEPVVAGYGGTAADLEVANPYYSQGKHLMLGQIFRPDQPLQEKLVDAIARKSAKNHADKEGTVLILDYRGNFPNRDELKSAQSGIEDYLKACPFMEVWFYVGYFSDNIGNDAEFAFVALKLDEEKSAKIAKIVEDKGLDDLGRLLW